MRRRRGRPFVRGAVRSLVRTGCVPLIAGLCCAPSTATQAVQRCEGPDGSVTYAAPACPPGTRPVRRLDEPPAPSEQQQREARERAARDLEATRQLRAREQAEQARAARERAAAQKQADQRERHCRQLDQKVAAARAELERAPLSRRDQAQRRLQAAQDRHSADCPPR